MRFIELPVADIRTIGLRLPEGMPRSAVYLLEFRNGERYLGQTPDLVCRIGGHCRTWDDIFTLRVLPVAPDDLEEAYCAAEAQFGRLTRSPLDPPRTDHSGWDPYLERVAWIEQNVGERVGLRPPEPPGQRDRTRPLFDRLVGQAEYPQLRRLIARYLDLVVPAPAATERRNWVITSLPSTMKTRAWHRLICLSINNVEAVTIGKQFVGEGWTVCGFMSAAPTAEPDRKILSIAARRRGAHLVPAYYKTVGDVTQIGFDSLAGLELLLRSDAVLDLVGTLVMRLVRRGRGMYGRFHDYNLADEVLGLPGVGVNGEETGHSEPAGREGFEPSEAL